MDNGMKTSAMLANLEVLSALLHQATVQSQEATLYMVEGEPNQAIGTIVGLEQKLSQAQHLLGATHALHQHKG